MFPSYYKYVKVNNIVYKGTVALYPCLMYTQSLFHFLYFITNILSCQIIGVF